MNKKFNFITGLVVGILTGFGFTITLFKLFQSDNIFVDIASLVLYILVFIYLAFGYNVPHGNLLRWEMMIVSFGLIFFLNIAYKYNLVVSFFLILFTMLCIAYCSGRLNKLKRNTIILGLAVATMIAATIINVVNYAGSENVSLIVLLTLFNPLILVIDIVASYISRYKDHKDAALE